MNNIKRIQEKLIERNLDGILITDEKNQRFATGFAFTDGIVLVTREKAFLMTDSRYIEAAEKTVSDEISVSMFGGGKKLSDLLIACIEDNRLERLGAEEQKLSYSMYRRYETLLKRQLIPAQTLLSGLRMAKTQSETDCMKKAQAIAEKALEEVLALIAPGMTERELAAEINYRMMRNGAEGNSFDTIAVTGKNTSMPHGVPGDEPIKEGDFVTMDFGCVKNGYCSDMTRTVAVGYATEEMKNVYDIVLKAQLAGIAGARAGISGGDIDAMGRGVIAGAGFGEYFGHSFGHSLGLDIHEYPVASPNAGEIMPVGAVISAEPGIYIPGKFGVRIEDVLILKEDGCENITKANKNLIIL